jgi:exopolysaccharide biosynthesis polyprenyl glycosylphosphotransferase
MRLASRSGSSRLSQALVAATGRVLVVWLALAMVAGAHRGLDAGDLLAVSLAAGVWLLALRAAFAGTPRALGVGAPAAVGTATGLVGVAALNPLLHVGLQLSVPALLGLAVGVFVSTVAWESVVVRLTGTRRVLVIGSSGLTEAAMAPRARALSIELLAAQPPEQPGEGRAAPMDDLARVVTAQRPDLVVFIDDQSCSEALDRLLDIRERSFRVAGLTSFYEHAFGYVPLPHLTPVWFMGLLHFRQRPEHRPSKRVFDIVLATVGLVLTAPLLALIYLAITRTPGPVIYRQIRLGEGGRHFRMYKFRTMRDGAERPGEAVWAQDQDPRTTGVGRVLRATHLDELPQLWNVLRGDMSIVGPRPERPEFIELLEATVPYWSRRLLVRPGLTGWAQVNCGYAADSASAAEKLSYDFWYLRHGNLAVDLAICARTLVLLLGVIDPRRVPRVRRRAASEPPAP